MINTILAGSIQQQKELSQLCSRLKERCLRFRRNRSFFFDTTDDDCVGSDLITFFDHVMDAESIDVTMINQSRAMEDVVAVVYYRIEQALRLDEPEESMKCSCQSVHKFDQASLQIESVVMKLEGRETGRIVLAQGREGGCACPNHTSLDHKSLEGGGLENSGETLRPGVSSSRRARRHAGGTPTDDRIRLKEFSAQIFPQSGRSD